jgi:serine/threonine protein kinase
MARKTHRHRGGKMVSKGAYGCGFIPALICQGNAERELNGFSKLMRTKDAEEEWKVRSVISQIDPQQKYSLYPTRMCSLDMNRTSGYNNINSCGEQFLSNLNAATFKEDLQTKYKILQMPAGGTSLSNLKLSPKERIPFFKTLKNLFNGLIIMHSNDFYHLDIKPDNIMVVKSETGEHTPRFIDFGLSRTTEEFIKDDKFFVADYLYWPYEFRFLAHRDKMIEDDAKIKNIIAHNLRLFYSIGLQEGSMGHNPVYWYSGHIYIPEGVHYMGQSRLITADKELEIYKEIRNTIKKEGIDQAFREILEKTDVYSLGMVLAYCMTQFMGIAHRNGAYYIVGPKGILDPKTSKINDSNNIDILNIFYELIHDMLNYNPYDRPTAREALHRYNRFLKYFAFDKHVIEYELKQHPVTVNLIPKVETATVEEAEVDEELSNGERKLKRRRAAAFKHNSNNNSTNYGPRTKRNRKNNSGNQQTRKN